ncbi:MAG: DUF3135 domain-containing protein [Pseudomonadota bacterium]
MGPDLPDFDELLRLAKENPQALENLRKASVEALINDAPEIHKRKLRGLQFKVDMVREKAKTPIAACMQISEMMHQSFGQLREALNAAQSSQLSEFRKSLNPNRFDKNSLATVKNKEKTSIRVHLPQSSVQEQTSKTTVVPFKRQHSTVEKA